MQSRRPPRRPTYPAIDGTLPILAIAQPAERELFERKCRIRQRAWRSCCISLRSTRSTSGGSGLGAAAAPWCKCTGAMDGRGSRGGWLPTGKVVESRSVTAFRRCGTGSARRPSPQPHSSSESSQILVWAAPQFCVAASALVTSYSKDDSGDNETSSSSAIVRELVRRRLHALDRPEWKTINGYLEAISASERITRSPRATTSTCRSVSAEATTTRSVKWDRSESQTRCSSSSRARTSRRPHFNVMDIHHSL